MEPIVFEEQKKLVLHTIKKVFKGFKNAEELAKKRSMDLEDLIQIGDIALWESILRFDRSKGYEFSTYACSVIRGKLLNEMNRKHLIKISRNADSKSKDDVTRVISLQKRVFSDEEDNCVGDLIESDYNLESEVLINFKFKEYEERLSEREYVIFKMRLDEYSFKEIAQVIGSTPNAVQKTFSKVKGKLKKEAS